mgnify:CR=1 FL=1
MEAVAGLFELSCFVTETFGKMRIQHNHYFTDTNIACQLRSVFEIAGKVKHSLINWSVVTMARKVAARPSPGKGGVKHDIKKPIVKKKVEKQKLNIIERMVRSSPRTSARKALSEISNELSTPVKKEAFKNELMVESPDEENKPGSYFSLQRTCLTLKLYFKINRITNWI